MILADDYIVSTLAGLQPRDRVSEGTTTRVHRAIHRALMIDRRKRARAASNDGESRKGPDHLRA